MGALLTVDRSIRCLVQQFFQLKKMSSASSWSGESMGMKSFMQICKCKSHIGLVPLFLSIGIGCTLTAASCFRTLAKDPDVMIFRRSNPEPWEDYRNKQFVYYSSGKADRTDCQAPKYWTE